MYGGGSKWFEIGQWGCRGVWYFQIFGCYNWDSRRDLLDTEQLYHVNYVTNNDISSKFHIYVEQYTGHWKMKQEMAQWWHFVNQSSLLSRIRQFFLFWLHHLVFSLPTLLTVGWYCKACFGIFSLSIHSKWSFHLDLHMPASYIIGWILNPAECFHFLFYKTMQQINKPSAATLLCWKRWSTVCIYCNKIPTK